jgi:hypothetical protein
VACCLDEIRGLRGGGCSTPDTRQEGGRPRFECSRGRPGGSSPPAAQE